MPRTATTVTVLAPAGWPRSTWSGSQGDRASFSAKQQAILPGHACVDFSMPSGFAPPRLRMTRRSARPIVAFALMFPPKHAVPPLIPSRPAIGPLTMTIGAAPPVVHAVEPTWKSGWSTARTLASTTGKYSGRQPAITAFAATFSTVTVPWSGSMRPRTSSGAHVAPRSIASTSVRCRLERLGHHRHRGPTRLLDLDAVVETPRHARPSVSDPVNGGVAGLEQPLQRLRRRRHARADLAIALDLRDPVVADQ